MEENQIAYGVPGHEASQISTNNQKQGSPKSTGCEKAQQLEIKGVKRKEDIESYKIYYVN
jgi:hypothetical protein